MILVACAVDEELAFLRRSDGIEVLVTGVGPVEAACAVSEALAQRPYALVINAGLGGAFDGCAAIGDGVVVAQDCMELRLESGEAFALPRGQRTIETAHSDSAWVRRLTADAFSALRGVTVARVTATEVTAARLAAVCGAQVESMEGFAVLRAAERAGVPAVELRGISNRCGSRESSGWSFSAGVAGLQRILEALLVKCIR